MSSISLQYADINPTVLSMGECESCNESIDASDGEKYVAIGFKTIARFHESCFMRFITGAIKFQELFLVDRIQDNMERKIN